METIDLELALADLAVAERRLDRLTRSVKTGDKSAGFARETAEKLVEALSQGSAARDVRWSAEERASLLDAQLITLKPVLYVCNVDEDGIAGNDYSDVVRSRAGSHSGLVVICAEVEAQIAQLDETDRASFLADLGLEEPGLATLAREAYRLLGLETFFTAGPKEIRAWTIHAGTRAPQAAATIHTDFERGFIRAEVYRIDDLLTYGSEAAMKSAGKLRVEGKDYVVEDGDVMHFRFNV
jgi:GTP-binding protein YchF